MRIDGNKVSFSLIFDKPTDPFIRSVVKAAETAVLTYVAPDVEIRGNIAVKTRRPNPVKPANPLPGVKNIVGISSGKGGVGKSTVASNLAVALARRGYRVGLLDADIFGPSVPKMFGIEDEQLYMHTTDDGRDLIIPAERYGVKVLSIGFMVDKNSAVLWQRLHGLQRPQPAHNPGRLGRARLFPYRHAPRHERHPPDLSADSRHHRRSHRVDTAAGGAGRRTQRYIHVHRRQGKRAGSRYRREHVVVHSGTTPDERYYIFGREGAARLAEELGVDLLGSIPVVADICARGDSGEPIALQDSITGEAFMELADAVTAAVDRRNATMPATQKVEVTKR